MEDRIALKGQTLRTRTARGTIVNSAFVVGLNFLGVIRGFVVAAFLTTQEYGVWGIVLISIAMVGWLKEVGVGDKFVQQSEDDQELAFQKAFTIELAVTGCALAVALASTPLVALVYGEAELIAPMLALSLLLAIGALASPLWIFYRRMDFVRQRTLQAVDPVVSFGVTVALAAAGAGYWSLVIGVLLGGAAGAAVALIACPYRIALRWDRDTARGYFRFSWPVFVAGLSGMVVAQGSLVGSESMLGLAGAGAVALSGTISSYADRADQVITSTLYPAVCAVRDRTDLLFEAFVKSNRLALMWGIPFGVGVALFAPDLVEFVIGDQWEPAVLLLQLTGVSVALYQIGFNWSAFFRARGETRPIAVVGVASAVVFLAAALPLMAAHGLNGFAVGMLIVSLAHLAGRTWYLTRLFPAFGMVRHSLRAIAPSLPPLAAVLAARAAMGGGRSAGQALAELALYAVATAACTLWFERALLRELAGYLRGRARRAPAATASSRGAAGI